MLAKGLRENAYAVDIASTGPDATYQTSINDYDAIILDVMLPGQGRHLGMPGNPRSEFHGACADADGA